MRNRGREVKVNFLVIVIRMSCEPLASGIDDAVVSIELETTAQENKTISKMQRFGCVTAKSLHF